MSDVEVLASSKIEPALLATFTNSFMLSNYEWAKKGDVPEDEEDKKEEADDEDVDERTKRKVKTIDSFEIAHELDLSHDAAYKLSMASARATIFARDLSNTRGSEANPEWMEAQVRELLSSK